MTETKRRSITKAITYRLWQSLNTFIIALLVTKDYESAATIVSFEILIKVVVYYLHERIWNKVGEKANEQSP
jgi:hypothetical protein